MRVFVTGANGFIGRHLMSLAGHHDISFLSRRGEVSGASSHARVILGDIATPQTWLSRLQDFAPDCCVHLAWEGLPDYSEDQCKRNHDAGIGVVDALVRARVKRVVVAGSCWEYGEATGAVAESHVPEKYNLFARTKHELRSALEAAAIGSGMSYRWARIFFAYGRGQRSNSLVPQSWRAFHEGVPIDIRHPRVAQDFIHVEDVARGLLALLESETDSGIYNIGCGKPTAVGEVVNQIAKHFGAELPFPNPTIDTGFWADTRKIRAATGWQPRIELRDGIALSLRELEAA